MSERMRAVALVDTGAIERNCRRLRGSLEAGAELCAVVKADGYGHGIAETAAAALAGGASRLAVAAAEEARALRETQPEAPILVMGALSPAELELCVRVRAELAVWDAGFLDAVGAAGAAAGVRPLVHVKYDSGMGRLGEREPSAVAGIARAVAASDSVELAGVWTHFATADEPGSGYFDEQLGRFSEVATELRAEHPGLNAHAANSAATLREPASHFDMVRCGLAIYGLDPFHESAAARELEPALELRSYVAAVKRFERGASAGYGQTWRAPAETWVGVVPVGYGDGYRRALTNNAEVLVGGRRHPVVGTISMDNLTIDLGPATDVAVGDPAVLIGAQGGDRIPAEELARRLATINYEVTTQISPRVPRVYRRS